MSPLQRLFVIRLVIFAIGAIGTLLLIISFFFRRPRVDADGSRFSLGRGILYFVLVWLGYCGLALLLAGWNATFHQHPVDLRLTFAVLALLAWAGYWFALAGSPYLRISSVYRHIGLALLSFAALCFSTFLWLLFAINIYGA